jgi:UTP-glucose-1-phosphate uridylyltransferase
MNINTMRRLDCWTGIPACWVLTRLRRLGSLLWADSTDGPPRRIAIIKLAEQGATVLAAPALRRAIELVGAENVFFVVFEDARAVEVFREVPTSLLAVQEVPAELVNRYGIVAGRRVGDRLTKVEQMVEKPNPEDAPSRMGVAGRYILTPDVFPLLEATATDQTGEIQLTNALKALLKKRRPIYAMEFQGRWHDAGTVLGFLKTTIEFALQRPDLAPGFKEFLQNLDLETGLPRVSPPRR